MRVPFLSHCTTKRQYDPSQAVEMFPPFYHVYATTITITYTNNDTLCPVVTPGERSANHPASDRVEAGQRHCLIRYPLRRAMAPFGIIPLRQQEEEVDKPHLELANSHTFIQLRQICRSVQNGTDKHLFYINRYTIPGRKIQASRFPVLSSAFTVVPQ